MRVSLAVYGVVRRDNLFGSVVLHATDDGPYYGDDVVGPYDDPVGDVLTVHVMSWHDDSVESSIRFEQLVQRLRMAVQ